MSINIENTPAELKHLNLRKEGPDDEKALIVDMKLVVMADSDILGDFDMQLHGFLFTPGGEVRYPRMGPVQWSGEMKNLELEIAGLEFAGVKLRKFQFQPVSLKGTEAVQMTCTATFMPTGRETAVLAEYVGEIVEISVRPQPELDLGGQTP